MSSAVVHQSHPGDVEDKIVALRPLLLGKVPVDVGCCRVGPTDLPVVKGKCGPEPDDVPDQEGNGNVRVRRVVDLRRRQTPSASTVEELTS